jgi:hypothetical protein
MNKPLLLAFALLAVCAAAFAGGGKEAAPEAGDSAVLQNIETAQEETDEQSPNYTGTGGKGISIEIRKPQGRNLGSDIDDWLPAYVQNNIYRNFQNYSAMNVSTPETREAVIDAGESGAFANEEDFLRANQAVVTHILDGTLIKVSATQYSLDLKVSDVGGNGVASFTWNAAPEQLRDGAALNQATAELLTKMGVQLTAEVKAALAQPLSAQIAESQTFLAKSDTAPTEFERMQYTYQAAALDPSLTEAARRLAEFQTATFSIPDFKVPEFTTTAFTPPVIRPADTGNIGADARDELARYRANQASIREQQETLLGQRQDILDQWQGFLRQLDDQRKPLRDQEQQLFQRQRELVAMLREAERFYAEHPPFRIFYNPKAERYGELDLQNETANLRFEIVVEPMSVEALQVVLDALRNLNDSFAAVNTAFGGVNRAMTERFSQVRAAVDAVRDALGTVNTAGRQYNIAAVDADWNIPPGNTVNGATLTTSWPVDYLRTFSITASLLDDRGAVIGRGTASLDGGLPLRVQTVSDWCYFNNVKINDITDTLTVRIDTVNDRNAATAAAAGYIAIDSDWSRVLAERERIAAEQARITAERAQTAAEAAARAAADEARRRYWSSRFYSVGAAVGTAFVTPAFLVSARLTLSPFRSNFFELGSDFGLAHGGTNIGGVEYFSIAPYLHFNLFAAGERGGVYAGFGGGASFSQYTYPSESHIDPVTVSTPVVDFLIGGFGVFPHSGFDLRYTIKTNFTGVDHRLTLGYIYRFGYLSRGRNTARSRQSYRRQA